jgi:hypothetical protein
MPPVVTSAYAALFAVFFVLLSVRVIGQRRSARISLGDGGDGELLRRTRAHANFAEYVPLTLILMMLAELQGQPVWCIHLTGVVLLVGRAAHALGLNRVPQVTALRVAGMTATIAATVTGAVLNLLATLAR